MRYPLIPPVVSIALGIFGAHQLRFTTPESAWPIVAFTIFALAAKTPAVKTASTYLALFFAGALTEAWHRPGPTPTIDASSKEIMILDGCVVEPTVFTKDREQFTLELDPGARARVSFNLDDETPPQRLDYGQHVEIEARIRPPHNYNNPGEFDYALYLSRQKIFWTAAMARHTSARILPGRCGSRFWAFVYGLRTAAIDRIEKLYPNDAYSTGMLEATLIGEKSKLEKVWTDDFRRTGTYHTLVIAGFHVTILATVLLFLLRICLLDEMHALLITTSAAWLYALVSGMNAPVIRAAGGFTLYAIARFFFRRGRILNLLAAIAIIYLIYDPDQLYDAAFQLSFLCVAAIGALAAPLLNATSVPLGQALRHPNSVDADVSVAPRLAQFRVELRLIAQTLTFLLRIPMRFTTAALALIARGAIFLYELAVISLVVQVGLALPMAEYFHRVSFSGFTANLIVSPLMGFLVPVGFLAILTGWRWVAWIAAKMLHISAAITNWHAHLEPNWRIADPPLWLAVSFIAALIALAIFANGSRRTLRRVSLAAVLLLFTLLIWEPFPPNIPSHVLELTAIDVGQGDSLLVVFPNGALMLVDGGGILEYGRQRKPSIDTGEDVVSPYLWSRGIRKLDIVVATHAHEDHSGGLRSILDNFHPRELWVGTNPKQALVDHAKALHIPVLERRTQQPFDFSGARIEILSPPPDFEDKPGNNDSLAFRIHYGCRNFLLTGDMEKPMEARLLDRGADLHSDVLKVGHHGSKTSTTQAFLDAIKPSIALISDGFENSFGHPNKDVLARLEDHHAATLRTDLDGLVTVRTDGQHLSMDTMRWSGETGLWLTPVF